MTTHTTDELEQEWTVRGTVRMVSYLAVAVVSGFVWYGIIKGAQWLLRALGVNV